MKVFYAVLIILFLCLIVLYAFMSIRLNMLSKKKRKAVENSWTVQDLTVVKKYNDAVRVTLKEIFLGIDNGKNKK